jgi:hypothetical protein
MIRHQKAQPAMPRTFLVVVFHRCEDGIADDGTTQLILALGTQLMVMKNQLPSGTDCGIVCGSFCEQQGP